MYTKSKIYITSNLKVCQLCVFSNCQHWGEPDNCPVGNVQ